MGAVPHFASVESTDFKAYKVGFDLREFRLNDVRLVWLNQINGPRCNATNITEGILCLKDMCYQSHNMRPDYLLPSVHVPRVGLYDEPFPSCKNLPTLFMTQSRRNKRRFHSREQHFPTFLKEPSKYVSSGTMVKTYYVEMHEYMSKVLAKNIGFKFIPFLTTPGTFGLIELLHLCSLAKTWIDGANVHNHELTSFEKAVSSLCKRIENCFWLIQALEGQD